MKQIHPFHLLSYVFLPDHFHWLMHVADDKGDFSRVLHSVKRNFTLNFKKKHRISSSLNVWQKRFWDHIIRDENDLSKHFDYIHWNPVKHGYVSHPEDWVHSSFNHWLNLGYYEHGWGRTIPERIVSMNLE